ncbi:ETC complex I subunit conserved region-domain-containing protein [Tuber brumale]|nr:ETC complex I subunit conserved region-domain-containing protein [Tuber brumale]
MLPTLRLFAQVGTQRLAPFSTTGITGILTHPNPRPALIAVYNHTLSLLSRLPQHSVYRQSTENLTKQRLAIVESVKPEGWAEYQATLKSEREANGIQGTKNTEFELKVVGKQFSAMANRVTTDSPVIQAFLDKEVGRWGLDPAVETSGVYVGDVDDVPVEQEGSSTEVPLLPEEPPLHAEQVAELEEKIGAGLIEEVLEQGWNELNLVKEMEEAKVWEPLEVQPEEGQWVGFERTS